MFFASINSLFLLRSSLRQARSISGNEFRLGMEASLNLVWNQMKDAAYQYAQEHGLREPKIARLIAVSKTKPISVIEEAYACGQRCFGENYKGQISITGWHESEVKFIYSKDQETGQGLSMVQELVEKANILKQRNALENIQWHFIGHLQRNKVNNLCSVGNLEMVETVDSVKIADALNRSWGRLQGERRLKILVQVNTSQEENKNGCNNIEECLDVVKHISSNCTNLQFAGLMTIGALATSKQDGSNNDFTALASYRSEICRHLGFEINDLELSMGMSADFVSAILAGSTNIRVGSTIFGKRVTSPTVSQSVTSDSQSVTSDSQSVTSDSQSVISDSRNITSDSVAS